MHGRDHSSIPSILRSIGEILVENNLSNYSILFFLEQLRIEKLYLGNHHHDLVDTLYRIGDIYLENNYLSQAEKYFSDTITILNKYDKKGPLYAITMYNLGLIKYHHASYDDAFQNFDLAMQELRNSVGEYHQDVSRMLLRVVDFRLKAGKFKNAMDNCLEALMIQRVLYGNTHSKISKTLCKVGYIHKVKSEYSEALNAFQQALYIVENCKILDESKVIILNEISVVYQLIGDVENTIKILQEIIETIAINLGARHICIVPVVTLLRNIYAENAMIESSKAASKYLQDILNDSTIHSYSKKHDNFANAIIKIFGSPIDHSARTAAAA